MRWGDWSDSLHVKTRASSWNSVLCLWEALRQRRHRPNRPNRKRFLRASLDALSRSQKWRTALALRGRANVASLALASQWPGALAALKKTSPPWPTARPWLKAAALRASAKEAQIFAHVDWDAAMQVLMNLRQLRGAGAAVLRRCLRCEWRQALALLRHGARAALEPNRCSVALASASAWAAALALGRTPTVLDILAGKRLWQAAVAQPASPGASGPSRVRCDAAMRCDGFKLDAAWRDAVAMFALLQSKIGNAPDAYTTAEVLRACVSGSQWQQSLRMRRSTRSTKSSSRSLSYILSIRACSLPRRWLAVVELLGRARQERVTAHVGMYDGAIFSCKGTRKHPRSQWPRAVLLLQEAEEFQLRRNPFMLQATLRACQSNFEWTVGLTLLRQCLGNVIQAHANQYSPLLAVCARVTRATRPTWSSAWRFGLHLARETAERRLPLAQTARRPLQLLAQARAEAARAKAAKAAREGSRLTSHVETSLRLS
ncbi:unnamed protein product [Effrenium voratum]|uniref:Uncharacterized protein n=1 Tax=Effrenium voratum TaxID=2562239 RepID=A0AA36NEK2_9DINO|nr:unnamed protein product [Effrenium voratum]CAJ1427646.1 unnamed protein product [Effrenium voratum]CAJ1461105.1 unnamed protein product [Effrenium voratum]